MVRLRTLSWALTVGLLAVPGVARAQDLEAGKTPQQLFASTCSACHKGPQGLAKGRSAGAVAGFLAQHYTTGKKPAADLAGYLVAVGGEVPKPARAEREPRKRAEPEGRERSASRSAEEPDDKTAREKAAREKAARERAEARKAKREAARQAAPGSDRPPGLGWVPPQERHAPRPGQPVAVWSDPAPVVISASPTPLVHARALSNVQETAPQSPPAAPASAPAAVAAVSPAAAPASAPAAGAAASAGPPPAESGGAGALTVASQADAQGTATAPVLRGSADGSPAPAPGATPPAPESKAGEEPKPVPAEPFTAPIP